MKARHVAWFLTAWMLSGCAMLRTGTGEDCAGNCSGANDWLIDKMFEMQAEQAWNRVRAGVQAPPVSEQYAQGFKGGYVAAQKHWGDTATPAAPKSYVAEHSNTTQGRQAIQDWFRG